MRSRAMRRRMHRVLWKKLSRIYAVDMAGEYLILPAAILARLWIPEMIQSVSGVLEMPDEEEDNV